MQCKNERAWRDRPTLDSDHGPMLAPDGQDAPVVPAQGDDAAADASGVVNRRGNAHTAATGSDLLFTFKSLRQRTSFMKAKAAAMHASAGAIAVDNEDDEDESSARDAAARLDVPLVDAPLQVLREGWLLKQSKKLKMWQKRFFVLDSAALYWAKTPHDVPDGFFPIRKCQFLPLEDSGYTHVRTRARTRGHTHTHTRTHTRAHTHIHAHTHTRILPIRKCQFLALEDSGCGAYVYVYPYACMHACMHACAYVFIYVCVYVCGHVFMHVCKTLNPKPCMNTMWNTGFRVFGTTAPLDWW